MITEKLLVPNTKDAEMSGASQDDLPDGAFAYVEPGGKKDEQGKTVPRSLRHLPYKGPDGKPDPAHVRNALARLSQTDIPADAKAEANRKLQAAAKEAGVETAQMTSKEIQAIREGLSLYERGLISKNLFQAILKENGMSDSDGIVDPHDDHSAEVSSEQDSVKPVPKSISSEDPAGQTTQKDVTIDRNMQTATVNDPTTAQSQQNFGKGSMPKSNISYVGVGNPNSTERPKMDYPLDTNPLAITNDSSKSLFTLSTNNASSLMDALTIALSNEGVSVVHIGASQDKPQSH